jgi:hypothetical protein
MDCHHEVIGAAITAVHKREQYILLLQRSASKKFWPEYWYFLTEHAEKVDNDPIDTLRRGLYEETKLSLVHSNSKAWLRKKDPVYGHIFDGVLFHATAKYKIPNLNYENKDYRWHPLTIPFHENPKFYAGSKFIDGIVDDLMKLGLISVETSRKYRNS